MGVNIFTSRGGNVKGGQSSSSGEGPAGQRGSTGSQGPAGPRGATGATGSAGKDGSKGEKGDAGATGTGILWKGAWNAETNYATFDAVSYNGDAYVAKVQSEGKQPDTQAAYWDIFAEGVEGIVWKGAWLTTTDYYVGDAVSHADGSSYIAIVDHSGSAPTLSNTNWNILSSKGSDGTAGAPGEDGEDGTDGSIGAFGGDSQEFIFSNSITEEDPGEGNIGFNKSDITKATKIFIDNKNASKINVSTWAATIDDGNDSSRSRLKVFDKNNPNIFAIYDVVADNNSVDGYTSANISHIVSSSTFVNKNAIILSIVLSGSKGSQGIRGLKGNEGVKGVNWKGAWDDEISYKLDDVILHNGSTYIAIAANSDNNPETNTSSWSVFSSKGDTGATGIAGAKGEDSTVKGPKGPKPGHDWTGTKVAFEKEDAQGNVTWGDYIDLKGSKGDRGEGDTYKTTSSSTISLSTGEKEAVLGATADERSKLSYTTGQPVILAHDESNRIAGTVKSYDATDGKLVFTADDFVGSVNSSKSSWIVNLAGAAGPEGPRGAEGDASIVPGPIGLTGLLGGVTYSVTVAAKDQENHPYKNLGHGHAFSLSDKQGRKPHLIRGLTYYFDQSHVSNDGHPLYIAITDAQGGADPNGSAHGRTAYVDGDGNPYIKDNGKSTSDGRIVTFTVPLDAPDNLYYACTAHEYMGSDITVSDVGPAGPAPEHSTEETSDSFKIRFKNVDGTWNDYSRNLVGPQGPRGDDSAVAGPAGPMPGHNWTGGRKLKFQKPDGSWGDSTDLKGPEGPIGINWIKDGWKSTAVYAEKDAVLYAGSAWIALKSNTDKTPNIDNTEFWSKLASRGVDGESIQGDKGDTFTYQMLTSVQIESLRGPIGMKWMGVWNGQKEYKKFDAVYHDKSSYIALLDSKGVEPATENAATQWQLLAKEGEQGVQGETGERGLRGPVGETAVAMSYKLKMKLNDEGVQSFHFSEGGKPYTSAPVITLYRGYRYLFHQKDESNLNHELRFATSLDGEHNSECKDECQYTNGVDYRDTAGVTEEDVDGAAVWGRLLFTVPHDAPDTIFYYDKDSSALGRSGYLSIKTIKAGDPGPQGGKGDDGKDSISNSKTNTHISIDRGHVVTPKGVGLSNNVDLSARAFGSIGQTSAKFGGSKQYLSVKHNVDWDLGSEDFTVEGWFIFDRKTADKKREGLFSCYDWDIVHDSSFERTVTTTETFSTEGNEEKSEKVSGTQYAEGSVGYNWSGGDVSDVKLAFDGNGAATATSYYGYDHRAGGSNPYLGQNFGAGNGKTVTKFRVLPHHQPGGWSGVPNFKIYGGNNNPKGTPTGGDFTLLKSGGALTGDNWNEITFTNTQKYEIYKFEFYGANWMAVRELELYEYTPAEESSTSTRTVTTVTPEPKIFFYKRGKSVAEFTWPDDNPRQNTWTHLAFSRRERAEGISEILFFIDGTKISSNLDMTVIAGDNDFGLDVCEGGVSSTDNQFNAVANNHEKAFDDKENTFWGNNNALPCWLKYDLGNGRERAVSRMRIKPKVGDGWGGVKEFTLEGSLNNATWYKLYEGSHLNDEDWDDYDFENKTAYRFYRLKITDAYNGDWTAISEIEMQENLKSIQESLISGDRIIFNKTKKLPLVIGAQQDLTGKVFSNYFKGNIDNIRFSKGITRYIDSFNFSQFPFNTDEYTTLLLLFEKTLDSGSHRLPVKVMGSPSFLGGKVGIGSAYIRENSFYVKDDDATFNFRNGDFTVELWARRSLDKIGKLEYLFGQVGSDLSEADTGIIMQFGNLSEASNKPRCTIKSIIQETNITLTAGFALARAAISATPAEPAIPRGAPWDNHMGSSYGTLQAVTSYPNRGFLSIRGRGGPSKSNMIQNSQDGSSGKTITEGIYGIYQGQGFYGSGIYSSGRYNGNYGNHQQSPMYWGYPWSYHYGLDNYRYSHEHNGHQYVYGSYCYGMGASTNCTRVKNSAIVSTNNPAFMLHDFGEYADNGQAGNQSPNFNTMKPSECVDTGSGLPYRYKLNRWWIRSWTQYHFGGIKDFKIQAANVTQADLDEMGLEREVAQWQTYHLTSMGGVSYAEYHSNQNRDTYDDKWNQAKGHPKWLFDRTDDSHWDTLYEGTHSNTSAQQSYEFANLKWYRFYRIIWTSNWNGSRYSSIMLGNGYGYQQIDEATDEVPAVPAVAGQVAMPTEEKIIFEWTNAAEGEYRFRTQMRKNPDAAASTEDHKYLIYKNPSPVTISNALSDADMESAGDDKWDDHDSSAGKEQVFLISDWDMESADISAWSDVTQLNLATASSKVIVNDLDAAVTYGLTTREGEQLLQFVSGNVGEPKSRYIAQVIDTEVDQTYTTSAWVFVPLQESNSDLNVGFTVLTAPFSNPDYPSGDELDGCEGGGDDCHATSTHANKGSWEKLEISFIATQTKTAIGFVHPPNRSHATFIDDVRIYETTVATGKGATIEKLNIQGLPAGSEDVKYVYVGEQSLKITRGTGNGGVAQGITTTIDKNYQVFCHSYPSSDEGISLVVSETNDLSDTSKWITSHKNVTPNAWNQQSLEFTATGETTYIGWWKYGNDSVDYVDNVKFYEVAEGLATGELVATISKEATTSNNDFTQVFDTKSAGYAAGLTFFVGDKVKCVLENKLYPKDDWDATQHFWKTSVEPVGGGDRLLVLESPETIEDNAWHHYAIQRSGKNFLLFVDGTLKRKLYGVVGEVNNTPFNFAVGQAGEHPDNQFDGYVDELRISHKARYDSRGYDLPLTRHVKDEFTKLSMHFDEGLKDSIDEGREVFASTEEVVTDTSSSDQCKVPKSTGGCGYLKSFTAAGAGKLSLSLTGWFKGERGAVASGWKAATSPELASTRASATSTYPASSCGGNALSNGIKASNLFDDEPLTGWASHASYPYHVVWDFQEKKKILKMSLRDEVGYQLGGCNFGGQRYWEITASNDNSNWYVIYPAGSSTSVFTNIERGKNNHYEFNDDYGQKNAMGQPLDGDGYRYFRLSNKAGHPNWGGHYHMGIMEIEYYTVVPAVGVGDLSQFDIQDIDQDVEILKNNKIHKKSNSTLYSSDQNDPDTIFNELLYVDKGDLIEISVPGFGCAEKVVNQNYDPEVTLSYKYKLTSQVAIPTGGGKFGHGLKTFESSTDYLQISDHIAWELGEDFTIEAWIKLKTLADVAVIAAQDDDGVDGGRWRFYYDPTYGLTFDQQDSNGQHKALAQQESLGGWETDVWYHVAINRLPIGEWTLYRGKGDGKKGSALATVIGTEPALVNPDSVLYIGYSLSLGKGFLGTMDEVRISGTAQYDGSDKYTVPDDAFVTDDDTLLLLRMDDLLNGFKDLSNSGTMYTLQTDTDRSYIKGSSIEISKDGNNKFYGTVMSYDKNTGALVTDIKTSDGGGTFTDWSITLAGAKGGVGKEGKEGVQGIKGNDGIKGNKGDKGSTGNAGGVRLDFLVGVSGGSTKLLLKKGPDDILDSPALYMVRGFTYFLYQLDESNVDTDQISISLQSDGSEIYTDGSEYTGAPGIDGFVKFTVPLNAPDTLYYGTSDTSAYGIISVSDIGPKGNDGETGAVGATGEQGSRGPVGDQGVAGDLGSQGPQGSKGERGADGPGGSGGTSRTASFSVDAGADYQLCINPLNPSEKKISSTALSESKIKEAGGVFGEKGKDFYKLYITTNKLQGNKEIEVAIYKNGRKTKLAKTLDSSTETGIANFDVTSFTQDNCTQLIEAASSNSRTLVVQSNSIFEYNDDITIYEKSSDYTESWTAKALEISGDQGIIIEENAQDTSAGSWVCKSSDESPDKSVASGEGDTITVVVTADNIEDGGTIKFNLMTSTSVAGAGPSGEKGSQGEKGDKGDSGSVNLEDPATIAALDKRVRINVLVFG